MKQLNLFAQKHGFDVDGKQAKGYYKGYPFSLSVPQYDNILNVAAAVALPDEPTGQKLNVRMAELQAAKEFRKMKSDSGAFLFTKTKSFTGIKADEIERFLDRITDVFRETGAKPGCFTCHREETPDFAKYNGLYLPICNSCFDNLSAGMTQALETYQNQAGNYGAGLFGALVGALVGSIVWVVVGLLGYVAAIAGLAISWAAAKGYQLLGGKVTRVTPWIIGAVSLIALVFAQFTLYTIQFYNELHAQGQGITLLESMSTVMWLVLYDAEMLGYFLKDMALGVVFAGLGAFSIFRNLRLAAKAPAGTLSR